MYAYNLHFWVWNVLFCKPTFIQLHIFIDTHIDIIIEHTTNIGIIKGKYFKIIDYFLKFSKSAENRI